MTRRMTRASNKIMSAADAVALIKRRDVVAICGAGGGLLEPTALIDALVASFDETRQPDQLTFVHATGLGDRGERGMSPLARQGLCKRVIGGHWAQSPKLAEMAERNEIEAYNLPQGVIAQLYRCAAAHQPGLITHVGLGTFIDPRQTGGRLNERTTEPLVSVMTIDDTEYLFYRTTRPDVAIIRGSTADADGYISLEDEIAYLDVLAMAQAAHNNGGIVIAQVQKIVKRGTLHPRTVKIPGFLVDALVVVPEQKQLYGREPNRFFTGDYIAETAPEPLPLNERKVISRRAMMELRPGDTGNVGVGISDGIGLIAREEGLEDAFTLTVETGAVGGESAQGIFFGASVNTRAMMDMPSQFDFYDGGGLDVSFLSFAEVDQFGNVNVHRFNGRIVGTGGFINISQNSRVVVFSGTLTAGGLRVQFPEGMLEIAQEGRFRKFVDKVPEITFNGADALARRQRVLFVTERGVFRLTPDGLELFEIANGMNLQKDILDQMDFQPLVSPDLREMDARLFIDAPMRVREEWLMAAI